MAKIKTYLLAILCAISCTCIAVPGRDVTDIYRSQIGVRELTGHNDGIQVETYLKACGQKKGAPWCAAFVSWCYIQAEVSAVKSAYAPSWFPKSNIIYSRTGKNNQTPCAADVFGIWFANKGRIAHVGFIDSWPLTGNWVITVEGNTNEAGSREGDGVYRKRRLKSQIYKVSRWL